MTTSLDINKAAVKARGWGAPESAKWFAVNVNFEFRAAALQPAFLTFFLIHVASFKKSLP